MRLEMRWVLLLLILVFSPFLVLLYLTLAVIFTKGEKTEDLPPLAQGILKWSDAWHSKSFQRRLKRETARSERPQ